MFNIDKNIDNARTLPSDFYNNERIFEQSKNIFEQSTQIICSMTNLEDLSIYPFIYFPEFLDENLIITSDNKTITCMPNVCTHRGHLLASCANKDRFLQCRYHGRTFFLSGNLKNAPGFKNVPDFPSKDDHLENISTFTWNNFLFISLNKDRKVFDKLDKVDSILPNFPYSNLCKNPKENEYIINCHWALYCDNYLEGFHIPYVHKGLNDDIKWDQYKTEIFNEVILQKAIAKNSKNTIEYGRENNIYAYYFFIFPNIMINYYKWGISINIVEPIAKDKTRVKYIVYNLEGACIPGNSSSSVDTVELEDQEVVLSVQKGMKSKYYKSGKFSPEMEKGVHYFHRLISQKLLNFNKD